MSAGSKFFDAAWYVNYRRSLYRYRADKRPDSRGMHGREWTYVAIDENVGEIA